MCGFYNLAVIELPHLFEGIQADLFTVNPDDGAKKCDQEYLRHTMQMEKESQEIEIQDYFEQSMQKEQDQKALFEQDMFEYMDRVFNEQF